MTIELTAQSIITAGSILTALGVIIGIIFKVVRWFDRQKNQDEEIKGLKATHDADIAALKKAEADDIAALRKAEAEDIADIKAEQQILTYGILACLKGLKEQGCNGPVTEAIKKIEKHLNQRAHE